MSVISVFDKRGKEVYFDEQPGREYNFIDAMTIKKEHPSWGIHTNDWGYFRRAHDRFLDNAHSIWETYEVLTPILVVSCVIGAIWIVMSIVEIAKYSLFKWNCAVCTMVVLLLTYLVAIAGNLYIDYRFCKTRSVILPIDDFYRDTQDFWGMCNCSDFQYDYYKSTMMYFFTSCAVMIIAFFQLMAAIAFVCLRPSL